VGNKKTTVRIQSLCGIKKRAGRLCQNAYYMTHARPMFYHLTTLTIHDVVKVSMVSMYMVYLHLLFGNIVWYFQKVSERKSQY